MAAATAPPPPRSKLTAAPTRPADMELRKFVAPTRAQCLSRVRSEMGDQAIILSTRTLQQRWFLGLFRREQVEVTAGNGLRTMPRRRASAPPSLQARNLIHAARAAAPGGSATTTPGRALLDSPAAMGAICLGITDEIEALK